MEYPLLKEHNIGIDIKPLEVLLIPNLNQMIYCQKLKEYIENEDKVNMVH